MDSSTGYGMESTMTHVTGTFFLFETVVLRVDVAVIGAKTKMPKSLPERSNRNSGQGGGVYEAEI